ncbi:hypothetical protein [Jannaschia faecimaris]|nr:hypothetical protein [Jannaschia faecimaris]
MKPLRPAQARAVASHTSKPQKPHKMRKPKRVKKRKSIWEKVFDEIEDIFD